MVRDHKNRLICRIDVMGLAAVMIALLFIMPEFGPVTHPVIISVDLAKVRHPKQVPRADREDAIVVAVQRDGRIFFGRNPASPEMLAEQIRSAVNRGSDPRVYLRADARTKYANVKQALDGIRDAGIDRVTFLVEQRLDPGSF
jgi:biopolymer transport protein ExbD/biopolymer transport protein TolR